MTKKEQEKKERLVFEHFLVAMNLSVKEIVKPTQRPDFFCILESGKKIAVELTETHVGQKIQLHASEGYDPHGLQRFDSWRDALLYQVKCYVDDSVPLQVHIFLNENNIFYLNKIKRLELAKEIAGILNGFDFKKIHQYCIWNLRDQEMDSYNSILNYVDTISAARLGKNDKGGKDKRAWQIVSAAWVNTLSTAMHLQPCIDEKNKLLPEYKKTIAEADEYWLLVHADYEKSSQKFKIPALDILGTANSDFDRTFFYLLNTPYNPHLLEFLGSSQPRIVA